MSNNPKFSYFNFWRNTLGDKLKSVLRILISLLDQYWYVWQRTRLKSHVTCVLNEDKKIFGWNPLCFVSSFFLLGFLTIRFCTTNCASEDVVVRLLRVRINYCNSIFYVFSKNKTQQ